MDPTVTTPGHTTHRSPAETGIWVFILADLSIFALYFVVFAFEKSRMPELFIAGQQTLNQTFGGINTLLLLTSSYFMARAVQFARIDALQPFQQALGRTMLCGTGFLVIKTIEYSDKFSGGYHIATDTFFRNYFAFTGFHMLHVILGMSLLLYLRLFIRSSQGFQQNLHNIEGVGLYWHMVDLLWVILFTLIYLVP